MQETSTTLISQLWQRVWPAILSAAIAVVLIVGGLWIFADREYSSTLQIFVKQRYTLTDSYTAAKSAESISRNLAEVIRTSVFFDEVVKRNTVDMSVLLAMDEADRRDAWKETVDTEVVSNTAQLRITAYDVDPQQAEAIANTVAAVLLEQGSEWHSSPDTITLKIVDTALTSDSPTRPNLLLSGLAAACMGAMVGLFIVFFRSSTSFQFAQRLKDAQKARQPEQNLKQPTPTAASAPVAPAPFVPAPVMPTPVTLPAHSVLHARQEAFKKEMAAVTPVPQAKSVEQETYSVLNISNFHRMQHPKPIAPQSATVKTITPQYS